MATVYILSSNRYHSSGSYLLACAAKMNLHVHTRVFWPERLHSTPEQCFVPGKTSTWISWHGFVSTRD